MDVPYLIGHRGYPAKYPENTLVSLEAALLAGARYIEFDLQMTDDEVFILYHDDNLRRVSGVNRSVFNLTSSTLKNFQANEFERFKYTYESVRIARLDQALSLLHEYPEAIALVEVKAESIRHFGVEKIMPLLLEQLKPLKSRCFIISFDFEALRYVRANSDYKIGFVLPKYNDEYRALAESMKPELLVCNYRKLPDIEDLKKGDALWPGEWEWALYLMEKSDMMLAYASAGIRYIETDNVGELLQSASLSVNYFDHSKAKDETL
jgi:glycerophosphoryl diester phosphodiesterase